MRGGLLERMIFERNLRRKDCWPGVQRGKKTCREQRLHIRGPGDAALGERKGFLW